MNRSHQNWQPFPLGLIVLGLLWPLGFAAPLLAMPVPIHSTLEDNLFAVFLWLVLWPLGLVFVVDGLILTKSLHRHTADAVVVSVAVSILWVISSAVSVVIVLPVVLAP